MIEQIFTYLAFTGVFAVFAVILLANVKDYLRYRAEKKNKKEFDNFEESLVEPEAGSRFFSGETKLRSETTIYLPGCNESDLLVTEVATSVDERLRRKELGFVIRCYSYDDGTGIDLQLVDFVKGLEVLRNTLLALDAPRDTFIEYETGELYIYE